MTVEQAAFIADALLAMCEREPDRPFYSDRSMTLKLKVAEHRDPLYAHLMVGRSDDPLLRSEIEGIFELAKLTEKQSNVLTKRLDGFTFDEIGRLAGHSKQSAQRIFQQALKKLARAFRVYPYRGLSEVYRRELKRGSAGGRFGTIPVRSKPLAPHRI